MPKPEAPRKVIRQQNLWPTPIWQTQIWEFMRSKTRVTFNEDFIGWIQSKMKDDNSVRKSNKGGWQSDLFKATGEFEPLAKEIAGFVSHINLGIEKIKIPQLWVNVNKKAIGIQYINTDNIIWQVLTM